jgi:hypothetical protein
LGLDPRNIYISGDLQSYRSLLEEEKGKYPVIVLEKPFSKDELMESVFEVTT